MGKQSRKKHQASDLWPKEDSAVANRMRHSFALIATNSESKRITEGDRLRYAELGELALDEKSWKRLPLAQFQMLLYQQILASAWDPNPETMFRAARLYELAMHRMSNYERQRLAEYVAVTYPLFGNSFGRLFFPWALTEKDPSIIAKATLDFAQYFREEKEDGSIMAGAEAITYAIREGFYPHTGAMLAGVLMLGDRRNLPYLDGLWLKLRPEDELELSRTNSGFMYAATIEFLLRWMESIDESKFGIPAVILAQMRKHAMADIVYDVERDLPVPPNKTDNVVRFVAQWPAVEYGRSIGTRLQELADRELGEEVAIPLVMHAWGLEWVPLDDEQRRRYERTKLQLNLAAGRMGSRGRTM